MRLLINNCIASIHTRTQTGEGAFGDPIFETQVHNIEGLLTSRVETANLGELDTRYSAYDFTLVLTGRHADNVENASPEDRVIIGGKTHVVREVSQGYRAISLRRSRIQNTLTLFLEAVK